MAIKECPHCKKAVETITDFCPECGNEITISKQTKAELNSCSVIVFLFIGFFVFMVAFALPEKTPNSSSPATTSRAKTQTKNWYEGGNLHQKTLKEWTLATSENKLATCGDFAVSHPRIKGIIKNKNNIEAAKPYAVQLVTAIDKAAEGQGAENQKISEVAAAAMLLLKW